MAMACWRLSRNKILFLSCSLFITVVLVVPSIHLLPGSPSVTAFLSPVAEFHGPYFISSDSCTHSLHSVRYRGIGELHSNQSWNWIESTQVSKCGFQKLNKSGVSDLLNGSWIVVAGDSEARFTFLSLLTSVMGSEGMDQETIRNDLFKRKVDYHITLKEFGMKLDFIWAPYANNLTRYLFELRQNKTFPYVMLMGVEIWHMANINNATEYGASLSVLRENLLHLFSELGNTRLPYLFWVGMPKMMLDMFEPYRRLKMGDENRYLFDQELIGSKLLTENSGPFFKLDLHWLSDLCEHNCTRDCALR